MSAADDVEYMDVAGIGMVEVNEEGLRTLY